MNITWAVHVFGPGKACVSLQTRTKFLPQQSILILKSKNKQKPGGKTQKICNKRKKTNVANCWQIAKNFIFPPFKVSLILKWGKFRKKKLYLSMSMVDSFKLYFLFFNLFLLSYSFQTQNRVRVKLSLGIRGKKCLICTFKDWAVTVTLP